MRQLAEGMGARTEEEIRSLELVMLACKAELEAETPSPDAAPLNRAERRRMQRRR